MNHDLRLFQETIWGYFKDHQRELPWRAQEALEPYHILVSEMMLQQTQVTRVIPKYRAFLERFPTMQALARAPLSAVLAEWSGLGYNRRAKFLHEAAQRLAKKSGTLTFEALVSCKGIGPNTAAAVLVYAYNEPHVFIETNIRTAFIHHFFSDGIEVSDKALLPLIKEALDQEQPRLWYWALMDYGTYLKATVGNTARASRHYAKQSRFEGSKRQVRGQVLKLLKESGRSYQELHGSIPDDRFDIVMSDLLREGLVTKRGQQLSLG